MVGNKLQMIGKKCREAQKLRRLEDFIKKVRDRGEKITLLL